jgi:hypothetical protein
VGSNPIFHPKSKTGLREHAGFLFSALDACGQKLKKENQMAHEVWQTGF